MEKRSWKNLWCDRRKYGTHKLIAALVLAVILMSVSAALADTGAISDKNDKALFFTLFGTIQLLIGFIYISGQRQHHEDIRGIKLDIQELRDDIKVLAKEKLDSTEHDRLCGLAKKKRDE